MQLDENEIVVLRKAFAAQVCHIAGIDDRRVETAFGTVERERFLGALPWNFVRSDGFPGVVAVDDPVHVYQDVLFVLKAAIGVNNGRPSLHARMLHALGVRPGDRVCHLGAGAGYYSALLSALAGPSGQVTAVEVDADLSGLAKSNVASLSNAKVVTDDARSHPESEVDCIYVNYATETIPDQWIEHLAPGGRLVVPLGVVKQDRGVVAKGAIRSAVMRITRKEHGLAAQFICPSFFVGSPAGQDAGIAKVDLDGVQNVRSLVWKQEAEPQSLWFRGRDWGLSYDGLPDA